MITLEQWEANCKSHEFDRVYLIEVDYFGDEQIHIFDFPVEACQFAINFLGKKHLLIRGKEHYLDDVFFSKEEAEKHATFDNYPYRLKKEEK